jgi:phage/plasmid primase-like uncharacterized protein
VVYIARRTPTVKPKLFTATEIITGLGGNQNNGMCACPAHDDSKPSLCVKEGTDGKPLFFCFAGCAQHAVIDALKAKGLWHGNGQTYQPPTLRSIKKTPVKNNTVDFALRIIQVAAQSTQKPRDYLRGRGITSIPNGVSLITGQQAGNLGLRRFPHMVVTIFNDGKPVGVQVTTLTRDAKQKIEGFRAEARLTYGQTKGGHVVLGQADPEFHLVVSEGVETGLAAMKMFGNLPGIAALGAWNLPFINPPLAREYLIAGDNDDAGRRGAWALAAKLKLSGHRVRLAFPETAGTDWNDELVRNKKW